MTKITHKLTNYHTVLTPNNTRKPPTPLKTSQTFNTTYKPPTSLTKQGMHLTNQHAISCQCSNAHPTHQTRSFQPPRTWPTPAQFSNLEMAQNRKLISGAMELHVTVLILASTGCTSNETAVRQSIVNQRPEVTRHHGTLEHGTKKILYF